jgi:hypothetical protein
MEHGALDKRAEIAIDGGPKIAWMLVYPADKFRRNA